MILNFKLVIIDSEYCDYLRKFDSKVSYNKNDKKLRPFIGVLFKIGNTEYFAPLSSPKPKHLKMKDTLDFFKLKDGEYGAINFNNMIPVKSNNYKEININKKFKLNSDKMYQQLLTNQLMWLNDHHKKFKRSSYTLYKLYNSNKLSPNIRARCCNYKLLEEKCEKYNKQ